MSQPSKQSASVLRARLEFPEWYRSFAKSYAAWSNAPSDLKAPLLLSGHALAKAETWLLECPDKLSPSQKRYIVRSISQRAKEPASQASASTSTGRSRWQWRRSSDRNLWQLIAVILIGCWAFLPDVVGELIEGALNSRETVEKVRRIEQAAAEQRARGSRIGSLQDADQASGMTASPPHRSASPDSEPEPNEPADASPAAIEPPRALAAQPPSPPRSVLLSALASEKFQAGQPRLGLLLAIEAGEAAIAEEPADRHETVQIPQPLLQALSTRRQLSPPTPADLSTPAALFCGDGTSLVAATGPSQLTASLPGERSVKLDLPAPAMAAAALDRDCRRILVPNDDFAVDVRPLGGSFKPIVLWGHEAPVVATAFSPDGRSIVTASLDSTARVWDAATGRQRALLSGHDWHVIAAGFSPDGARIVTAGADNTARIWDASTGRQIAALEGHQGRVTSAAFNAGGALVVTSSWDGAVRLFDGRSGAAAMTLRASSGTYVTAVADRDGTRLATLSSEGTSDLWELNGSAEPKRLNSLFAGARRLAFSTDGRWIAVHSWSGSLAVHDSLTGTLRYVLGDSIAPVAAFTFDPSGKYVSALRAGGEHMTWPLVPTLAAALEEARAIAPSCLSADERTLLGLAVEQPAWCAAIKPRDAALPAR